jgi:3-dehydroquinate synthase
VNGSRHYYLQRLEVGFDYPVVFTRDAFNPGNEELAAALCRRREPQRHKVLVFVDSGVAEHHPALFAAIRRYFLRHRAQLDLVDEPCVVPGGERAKTDFGLLRDVLHALARPGFCRHSCVVAVGGGAVLDAVGFATALVHRGLRLVRLPTTVVGQNDAGVGVKNGVNTESGKNTIGTFAPPFAVINDFDFLRTLPDRDWIAGAAEAFKVAIIKDRDFFEFLATGAERLRARDLPTMERLVERCAELHLDHIRTHGDPFEQGTARPLDFGHWSAHAIESMSDFRIRHGEAVAAGLAIDARYAERKGWLSSAEAIAVCGALRTCGFPLWYDEMGRRGPGGGLAVLDGLDRFREHLGGELCLTFPRGIGAKIEVREVDRELMAQAIGTLRPPAG